MPHRAPQENPVLRASLVKTKVLANAAVLSCRRVTAGVTARISKAEQGRHPLPREAGEALG